MDIPESSDDNRPLGRKLRSRNEFSPYLMELDFATLLKDAQMSASSHALSAPCAGDGHESRAPATLHDARPPIDAPSSAQINVDAPHSAQTNFDVSSSMLMNVDTPSSTQTNFDMSPSMPTNIDVSPSTQANGGASSDMLTSIPASPTASIPLATPTSMLGVCAIGATRSSVGHPAPTNTRPEGKSYKTYRKQKARLAQHQKNVRSASTKTRAKALDSSVVHSTELRIVDLPAARDGYSSKNPRKVGRMNLAPLAPSWTPLAEFSQFLLGD
ncbi:hypothetical protein BDN71DRAFT_1510642 [Pleurotus eryngii]|uniref:Uncharacterized protein n=1 Tax=Pleurotus eryngii TaxID=5323 RepID=A0A9P5ZMT1_PLEER|nr:hypothetical protein BDN71DRAFT_1510642 [Pleurotus eryngii]